jgi:glucokinase
VTARPLPGRHLGLDLGATNLKWTVVAHDDGSWQTLDRAQQTVDVPGGPDVVLRQLIETSRQAVQRWPGVATVGIGVPGSYDAENGTTGLPVNLGRAWMGRPVTRPIAEAVGLPTALVNDARAFGLAELRLGAGREARAMVGVVLGTGVGGVIALDGRVYHGRDGGAGEIGHMTIDPDGPDCNCGNKGCLEAFVRADRIAAASGTSTVVEAVERASNGDATAIEGLLRAGRYLGIAIANIVLMISADRVVVGGGVAEAGERILGPAREEVRRRFEGTALDDVEIVAAELGIWAGAIGAAIHGAEVATPIAPSTSPVVWS